MALRFSAAILFGTLVAGSAALAEQKAHVHGHWQLNAAIEGDRLQIELIAPGADVAGFEHEARTADEKAKVWKATEKLKAGDALIVLPAAAGCALTEAHAGISGRDHDDHDAHKHDDDHHKDDHKDDHSKHEDEAHNEYRAEYVFACSDIAKLHRIGVTIFDAFPSTQEIKAAVLTGKGQRAADLDKDNTVIDLDG